MDVFLFGAYGWSFPLAPVDRGIPFCKYLVGAFLRKKICAARSPASCLNIFDLQSAPKRRSISGCSIAADRTEAGSSAGYGRIWIVRLVFSVGSVRLVFSIGSGRQRMTCPVWLPRLAADRAERPGAAVLEIREARKNYVNPSIPKDKKFDECHFTKWVLSDERFQKGNGR